MSRQSAKFKTDDLINYDELLESSSMSGLVSFLTDIPSGPLELYKDPLPPFAGSIGIPIEPANSSVVPQIETGVSNPVPAVDSLGIPIDSAVSPGIPVVSDCLPDIPALRLTQLIAARHLRPIRTQIAQDGHSPNEQAVYWALWNTGKPIEGKLSRSVQIGYGDLGRKAGVSRNSAIRLLSSLEKKMSIQRLEGNTTQQGTCYIVYDFKTILESREKLGLLFAVRDRNAVHLLTEQEVIESHRISMGIPMGRISGIPMERTIGIPTSRRLTMGIPTVGIPGTPTVGIPGIPTDLAHLFENRRKVRENDDVGQLYDQLQKKFPNFDDAAVDQLWSECRSQVQDVGAEEVAVLFERKLPEATHRSISNPVGFLLRAVARSCTRAAISALRQGQELPKEFPVQFQNGELEALLDDPATPAELREALEQRLQQIREEKLTRVSRAAACELPERAEM